MRDLGLDPERDLLFVAVEEVASLDWRFPVAAVYFGGPVMSPAASEAVATIVKRGAFILPVVPALATYTAQVPAALHPINGMPLVAADAAMEGVAARVLEELRLLRARRFAFVSYRRAESRAVAVQLYHQLDDRGFGVFLDTHRVPRGVNVQAALWDQMADADVIVFLDTPNALSSPWVEQEVLQAQNLGIGVIQVLWPGRHRSPDTDLREPLYLEAADFAVPEGHHASEDATLTPGALDRIAIFVERVRARCQAARRSRVVEVLCRAAQGAGLEVVVQPTGPIVVTHGRGVLRVVPVVGHPEAAHYQRAFRDHPLDEASKEVVLLHDTDGFLPERQEHIRWLDEYLPVRSLAVRDVAAWISRA